MNYFVKRELREYGPYTEGDLRRYLASGHLSPDDLFRPEDGSEHRALSQLGLVPTGPALPPGAYAPAYNKPQMANGAPLPPNLHWGLVLLFTVLSCGFFAMVWMLMQAWWLKQLHAGNRSIWTLATSFGTVYAGSFVLGIVSPFVEAASRNSEINSALMLAVLGVTLLICLVGLGFFFAAEFAMRKEMLDYFNTVEDIQLHLHPVPTMLFGMYYLQYHMSRIAQWKKTGVLTP